MSTKIITTVGTSLFENYAKSPKGKKENSFARDFKFLKDKAYPFDKWEDSVVQKKLKGLEVLSNWCSNNSNASAEIKSILKIKEAIEKEVEVHLIATDTVLSVKAAELVKEWLENKNIKVNGAAKVITGLTIENANEFIDKGVQNLIEEILNIYEVDKDANIILNISGGFKAMIPVLTIVGQLYEMPLYYIYESSDTPIVIHRMPLNFDWDIIEIYSDFIEQPDKIDKEEEIAKSMIHLHLIRKLNEKYELTIVGQLISKFLKRRPPLFDTTFGYLVEYKIKECFDKEFECTNVLHGYKSKTNSFQGDLDIIVLSESNMETIEVKPNALLNDPKNLKRFMGKLIDRTKVAKEELSKEPKNLTLMVYKFKQKNDPDIYKLSKEQLITIEEVEKEVKTIFPSAIFGVKSFYVKPNKIKKGNRLLHQQFLKESLKFNQIKTIFPTH